MRKAVPIVIDSEQETQLKQITRSGTSPQRLVERAKVILMASEGQTNEQIGTALGITRQKAGRWRDRFAADGMAGILQDKPGRGRKPVITTAQKEAVVRKTTEQVPAGKTHWSTRTMAKASGLGATTIRGIWRDHGLKPHLARTSKVSNDTTTLFAALNVADGTVISTCQPRHRHQEWLKFLKLIDASTPPDKELHLIVDKLRDP